MAITWGVFTLLTACAPAAAPTGGPPSAEGDPQTRWAQTLAAAKKEGKLTISTNTSLYYAETVKKFAEKYPEIQVEHSSMRPSEFAPKLITEQQNGIYSYDATYNATGNMVEVMLPAGAFEKLPPYLILPEITNPSNWRGGQLIWGTNEPYILINRGNVDAKVVVNRDVLPKSEFNSVDQLLDSKFKGKITIRTPNAPHDASFFLSGALHTKGEEWVRKLLIDQQPVYVPNENARLLTQNVINGKYPLAIGVETATYENCISAGACNGWCNLPAESRKAHSRKTFFRPAAAMRSPCSNGT